MSRNESIHISISRGCGGDNDDQAPKKQLKHTKNELRLESATIYTFIQPIMKSILSFLIVNFFKNKIIIHRLLYRWNEKNVKWTSKTSELHLFSLSLWYRLFIIWMSYAQYMWRREEKVFSIQQMENCNF